MSTEKLTRMIASAEVATKVPIWREVLEKYAKIQREVAELGKLYGAPYEIIDEHVKEAETAEEELRLARQLTKVKES